MSTEVYKYKKVYPPGLEKMKAELPELPWDKKDRWIQNYGLTSQEANILLRHPEYEDFFVRTIREFKRVTTDLDKSTIIAKNYFFNNVIGFINKKYENN